MERLDRCKSMERRKPYSQTLSVENESTHKNHKTSLRLRKCNSSVGSAATFPSRARLSSKPYNCSFAARELHLIPGLRPDLLLRSKVNTLKPSSACWKTLLPRFARRNATHPPDLFRNCTPFALRALPSVGGSSAMRNKKDQIYFVLNLYRHLPRLGKRVKPCCARKGSPGNGISIFPSLCIYILFIII